MTGMNYSNDKATFDPVQDAGSVASGSGMDCAVFLRRRWKGCSLLLPALFSVGAIPAFGANGNARQAAPTREIGMASWYGHPYHGRQSASGKIYDMNKLTAAHRTLPFGTRVRILNLENTKTVDVEINDRGPFIDGRIIDVSRAAADILGIHGTGSALVEVDVLPALEATQPKWLMAELYRTRVSTCRPHQSENWIPNYSMMRPFDMRNSTSFESLRLLVRQDRHKQPDGQPRGGPAPDRRRQSH